MEICVGGSMKIVILTIATGEYYDKYLSNFIKSFSASIKLPNPNDTLDFIVFNDKHNIDCPAEELNNGYVFKIPYKPYNWTLSTLMRFHAFNSVNLERYDYVYFIDVDMLPIEEIRFEEIQPSYLIGVIHPGFANISKDFNQLPIYYHEATEKNPASTAFVDPANQVIYCQGCFFGGKTQDFVKMSQTIAKNIDKDFEKRIVAMWHDESHLNKYFNQYGYDNIDLLTPNYAHPEVYDKIPSRKSVGYYMFEQMGLKPKMLHLYKGN